MTWRPVSEPPPHSGEFVVAVDAHHRFTDDLYAYLPGFFTESGQWALEHMPATTIKFWTEKP